MARKPEWVPLDIHIVHLAVRHRYQAAANAERLELQPQAQVGTMIQYLRIDVAHDLGEVTARLLHR